MNKVVVKIFIVMLVTISPASAAKQYKHEICTGGLKEKYFKNSGELKDISQQEIKDLKRKWYEALLSRDYESLQTMMAREFLFGFKPSDGSYDMQDKDDYLEKKILWMNRGMNYKSVEIFNEKVTISQDNKWAMYQADISQIASIGNKTIQVFVHEVAYVISENDELKYAAVCGEQYLPKSA